jgi:hypothetical protein
MKPKFFILTILALLSATILTATESPKMSLIQLEKNKAMVSISKTEPAIHEMFITSADGQVLYYYHSRRPERSLRKVLDLSFLDDGNYSVKFKTVNSSLKCDFELKDGIVAAETIQALPTPIFSFSNNVLKISFLNQEQENVVLYVYSGNELIYRKELGNELSLQKSFDLSQIKSGDCEVLLANDYENFWYPVNK